MDGWMDISGDILPHPQVIIPTWEARCPGAVFATPNDSKQSNQRTNQPTQTNRNKET